jgi:iron complex transport system permease protein
MRTPPSRAFPLPSSHFPIVVVALTLALCLTLIVAVAIGPVRIAPGLVWRVILHELGWGARGSWEPFHQTIIWEIRVPRILLGGLVGAGLAVAGATLQALVRNPLADPYLLGVSAGASLGAVATLVLGVTWLAGLSRSAAAFLGALLALAAVLAVAGRGGRLTGGRLILAGVSVAYVFSALTSALIYASPSGEAAKGVLYWLLGGLAGARWTQLGWPAVILVGTTAWLLTQARSLNAVSIGEETATTLGVDTARFRWTLFALTSLLTGALVAVSGGIGFVGLMLPHIVRVFVGSDHRRVLPVAALVGAVFLIWVDVLARTVIAPAELPIGIITALLGAPFFLWMMGRGKWELGNGN